jgi:hypothetical protein
MYTTFTYRLEQILANKTQKCKEYRRILLVLVCYFSYYIAVDKKKGLGVTLEKGDVADLHFMGLNLQSEFVPIHEQPNHNIVHLNRLGEADRLAG